MLEAVRKNTLETLSKYNTDKLCISFSGGRTSAVMTYLLIKSLKGTGLKVKVLFANTGSEHPSTLDFVKNVENLIERKIVWLEAKVHHGVKKSSTYTEVSYETASRNGEPFKEVIKKYSRPNPDFIHCTRELKVNPIKNYLKDRGWVRGANGNYSMAIGIRADEIDRIAKNYAKEKYYYPLIDINFNKGDVNNFIAQNFPFDLEIPSDAYGNCVFCYKKSIRKLLTVAKENPQFFDFPIEMENKYPYHHITGEVLNWYRGQRTAQALVNEAKTADFKKYSDEELNLRGNCTESCEIDWALGDE